MQIVSLLTSYNYGYGGPRESKAWTEKLIKQIGSNQAQEQQSNIDQTALKILSAGASYDSFIDQDD